MAKQPTEAQIRAHYAAEVAALNASQLAALVRGDLKGPRGRVLQAMAIEESKARGIEFPTFTAHFTF